MAERESWQQVATVGSFIANLGGFGSEKTVRPDDLIPHVFGKSRGMSKERARKNYERHLERKARELGVEKEKVREAEEATRGTDKNVKEYLSTHA